MSYTHTWEKKGLLAVHAGELTCESILSSINSMCGDARFDDIDYRIVDFRSIEKLNITVDETKIIAHHDIASAKSNPRIRLAIVSGDESVRALSALYESEAAEVSWKIQIFSSMDKARLWVSQRDD